MKDRKKIILIISVIVVIMLIIGLIIYNFYKGYKEDKIKTQEIISNINANYDNFVSDLNKFNEQREKVYTEVFTDNYYIEFKNSITRWNETMKNYKDILVKIDNNSEYLKNNCLDLKLYNPELNKKCDLFINSYETIINYYISDIDLFNKNIDSYNTWVKDNGEEYELIEQIEKDIYKEYIDFNNDGVYIGKE